LEIKAYILRARACKKKQIFLSSLTADNAEGYVWNASPPFFFFPQDTRYFSSRLFSSLADLSSNMKT